MGLIDGNVFVLLPTVIARNSIQRVGMEFGLSVSNGATSLDSFFKSDPFLLNVWYETSDIDTD